MMVSTTGHFGNNHRLLCCQASLAQCMPGTGWLRDWRMDRWT